VPAFIVTLGGSGRGAERRLLWSGGQPLSGFSTDFTYWGKGSIGEIPVPVIIFVGLVLIAHLVLKFTAVRPPGSTPWAATRRRPGYLG
jgi:ribose transport system permease protein/inositol transport system permease protein